jgi:hypothetical protein
MGGCPNPESRDVDEVHYIAVSSQYGNGIKHIQIKRFFAAGFAPNVEPVTEPKDSYGGCGTIHNSMEHRGLGGY